MEDDNSTKQLSICRAARTIKRRQNTLFNALKSIYDDSIFVGEISHLWSDLPLLANLRSGLWYSPTANFHSTCYFKSTDGHTNNWPFNTSRVPPQPPRRPTCRTENRVLYCGCDSEGEAISRQRVKDDTDLDMCFESGDL
ncbi:hypothetical protein ACFX13_018150 [Malus domestica]